MESIVQHQNGRTYYLESHGFVMRDLIVEAPEYSTVYESVAGADGAIDMGTAVGPRRLTAVYYLKALNATEDFSRQRDLAFEIFKSHKPFYFTDLTQPHKRWLVKVEGSFSIEQIHRIGFFEVPLIALSGYAESINSIEQIFKSNSFVYNNDGDITIDPRIHHNLQITFKGVSNGLKIFNDTTGEVWSYDGSTTAEDEIVIHGVASKKNGVSIFRDTNKRLLTFEPGRNYMRVEGADPGFELLISTRFYLL